MAHSILVMHAISSLSSADRSALLRAVQDITRHAGHLILQIYGSDFVVAHKGDASPVTLADEEAEALIVPALQALWPGVPVVAEEAASKGDVPLCGDRFWLVDPLDGTREFVSRNGEFTVNIALIENAEPVLGVVYVPVADCLYAGAAGLGAWCVDKAGTRLVQCRAAPPEGLTLACSRSHGDEALMTTWLQDRKVQGRITAGSSLKFGLIASGQADLYPRFGRTMEWDTAAGHAVVAAAGGKVTDLFGAPLRYGKPGFENPSFVAWGVVGPALKLSRPTC
jgi:3'(2'), 5'-bisphosphate nucleotidase